MSAASHVNSHATDRASRMSALDEIWKRQIELLADEARRGDPIWRRPGVVERGIPRLAPYGEPFAGIDVLVLWRHGDENTQIWEIRGDGDGPVVGVQSRDGRRLVRVCPSPDPSGHLSEESAKKKLRKLISLAQSSDGGFPAPLRQLIGELSDVLGRHGSSRRWPTSQAHTLDWLTADALMLAANLAQHVVWVERLTRRAHPNGIEQLAESPLRELVPIELRVDRFRSTSQRPLAPDLLKRRRERLAPQLFALMTHPEKGESDTSCLQELILKALSATRILQALAQRPTGAPRDDWRRIGQLCRKAVSGGAEEETLAGRLTGGHEEARDALLRIWRTHRRRSGLHLRSGVTMGRYQRRKDERTEDRSRPDHESSLERDVLSRLWRCLGTEPEDTAIPDWDTLRERLRCLSYQRRAMRKADGGLRWLDVPEPRLAAAQRVLHEILRDRVPLGSVATAFVARRGVPWHARAHAGCRAAVVMDIRDFFGSVRPRHVAPWILGVSGEGGFEPPDLLPGLGSEARETILDLLFLRSEGREPFLAQGAPSSPLTSHLAACRLDGLVVARAQEAFGAGAFSFTRYADDLVLSLRDTGIDAAGFLERAEQILAGAICAQGWWPNGEKTRRWQAGRGSPLLLCGVVLPETSGGRLRLPSNEARRLRSAVHRLRSRACYREGGPDLRHSVGMVAWGYAVSGDPRLLAWSSPRLARLALILAGPVFQEAFLAGWADALDEEHPTG